MRCSLQVNIEQAIAILSSICAKQKEHDSEIMQGVDGEQAHALDVLSWVERLNSNASLSLKLAALFHDVDRVVNPAMGGGFKGDRHSIAYSLHKKRHAARSAEYIIPVLQTNGFPEEVLERTRLLILHHDDSGEEVASMNDCELADIVTADSFAFFTSIAPKLLAAEGVERIMDKIAFMIDKLPDGARTALRQRRLDDDALEQLKNEALRRYSCHKRGVRDDQV
jgi:hypothetical protein